MKNRRHHNNKGSRQVRTGKCELHIRKLAKEMGIPYGSQKTEPKPTIVEGEIPRADGTRQKAYFISA